MSINTIIVNTTTGADAATSINEVIDLVNAGGFAGATGLTGATGLEGATGLIGATGAAQVGGATLGANEFTGDQLINGTSKQIFAASVDPTEFTNIAKVTGAVQGGINIEEINFAFAPPNNSLISNSWLLEAYTDSTFDQGSEMSLGFNRGRMQVLNSIGSLAVMTVLNNPGNNLTTFAAFADNMLIGANAAQTRTAINVGHNALPNLNLRGTNINSFGNQFNVTAPNTNINGNLNVTQAVDATIATRRLHFTQNPFDNNPPVNLGAIRLTPGNKTLSYTVYDPNADIENQSYMQQSVDTEFQVATTTIGAYYNDVNAFLQLQNVNGVATLETNVDTTITGNLTVNGNVATTGNFIHTGALTIFDGSINMQPGSQVNTPVIDAGIARVSDFLVVGNFIGSGDGLTVNNTDFVITPVANLPAGVEGQIAFNDGKMFVFIGGSFKEVQFVTV